MQRVVCVVENTNFVCQRLGAASFHLPVATLHGFVSHECRVNFAFACVSAKREWCHPLLNSTQIPTVKHDGGSIMLLGFFFSRQQRQGIRSDFMGK